MIFGFKITLITGAIIYGLICLYNRDRLILWQETHVISRKIALTSNLIVC
jgi:hypothetical protein